MRWVRLIVLGGAASVALAAGTAAPAVLLMQLAARAPGYQGAGAVVALPVAAFLVWSPALARTVVGALGGRMVSAMPKEVARIADAARAAGQKVPTVLVAAADLPRPIPFRGLRRDLLVVSWEQVDDPAGTVAALAESRRRGDDRLVLLLGALVIMLGAWPAAMSLVTAAVRRGRMRAWDRMCAASMLPLAPVVAVGWGVCWAAVQAARAVLPRSLTEGLLVLAGNATVVRRPQREELVALGTGVGMSEMLTSGRVERRPGGGRSRLRTWWNTPQALAREVAEDMLGGSMRVVVGVMVVGLGTYSGLGLAVAERVAWPWEEPQGATVVAVQATRDPGSRSLVERLGADVGTTYAADARLADGRVVRLKPGSGPVTVGDSVRVVVDGAVPDEARSLTRSSVDDLVVLSVMMLLLGAGMMRCAGGGLAGLAVQRALALTDHDQRVMTGRRHRRRRPRAFFGMDLFSSGEG